MDKPSLSEIGKYIKGDLLLDEVSRYMYSTDASVYYEKVAGVVKPRDSIDIQQVIKYACENEFPLIPRGAGTSLAGQVVGKGLVIDTSAYMNKVLELNKDEKWVRVQPGVVLDELNIVLKKDGLFFGPETSTANRCTIGGMVGNNACGAHSLIYGSTRDHLLKLKGFLSNGDEVEFKSLSDIEFALKCKSDSLEGRIYRGIDELLKVSSNRQLIKDEFPHSQIKRRNTGYALDLLMDANVFQDSASCFNMCKLIAGSEGTLFFATEITLNLVDLPPKEKALICVHCHSLDDALDLNLEVLNFEPVAVELMDRLVLDLSKENKFQNENRFFIDGDPAALLFVEVVGDTKESLGEKVQEVLTGVSATKLAYATPVLTGKDISKVWNLRKAGLGVLSNLPGDERPVAVMEDAAVRTKDLKAFVRDVKDLLELHHKKCVFYAHVGSGELHLRPVLNLKTEPDREVFYQLAEGFARLVKKHKGSLSGEHGDGRLRGQFLPLMVGEEVMDFFHATKKLFDPKGIFNPGKIVATPQMNTHLRAVENKSIAFQDAVFNWESTHGFDRAIEKCNGSGDCRKSHLVGGVMCPSYMGTKDERNSTRGRANVLREFIYKRENVDGLSFEEVKSVLDLCLSCKACKNECPSNVDMTKLKAEFLNAYRQKSGLSLRDRLIADLPYLEKFFIPVSGLYNSLIRKPQIKRLLHRYLGLSKKRDLPWLPQQSLKSWYSPQSSGKRQRRIYLFADEFTNVQDSDVGIKAILLLQKLGYDVVIPDHLVSGRTYLSKGHLQKAQKLAVKNVQLLAHLINGEDVLIGIEPSAILTFRDEYLDLVPAELKDMALMLSHNCYTIEEFITREFQKGNINSCLFTKEEKSIRFHAHCYQKALSDTNLIKQMLEIPENYSASEIPSGCCGMAGSFGMEKEHYALSMKIGELVLFPDVRQYHREAKIAASGTSCRTQIKDGTGVIASHPIEVLYDALL